MNENNIDFKPLTLYSFFPKSKRLKLSKQDSILNYKKPKIINYTISDRANQEKYNPNKTSKKNFQWSNPNYKYNQNYKFDTNSKPIKFNAIASSTSNNFYKNHQDKDFSRKYSINNNLNENNNKYNFRTSSKNKNKTKDPKNKKQERIKSVAEVNFHHMQNLDNKEINEKFLEQFLDNYDSKLKRNLKDMKSSFTNNKNFIYSNMKSSNKDSMTQSLSKNYNMNDNEYINSLRFKNVIRLSNKDKIYNYLPYLNASSKDKKISPKEQKKLLVYGNFDVNTFNTGINPNGSAGIKNMNKFNNNVHILSKNTNSNNNSNKKNNNYMHKSSNPVFINNYNNNITTNSNISNTGNNNIIFNNMGSVNNNFNFFEESNKKVNNFDEFSRTNTAGEGRRSHYKISSKKNSNNNTAYDTMKNENDKINYIDENINDNKKNNNQKIIRKLNFLKEDEQDKNEEKEKEKESINPNNNKVRALSTVPYKNRKKNSKKNTINIDCNIENKDQKITNENINNIKKQDDINYTENETNNSKTKKDKLSKYEIGDSLGKGAYAIVKLVTNKITHEKYAMKIYEKEKLNSNSKKSCVYKEIQILKRIRHKNIVKLIEVISTEKQILIVQELIEGISLREYYNNEIRHQKGISIHKENIFRNIFRQIFEAMDYLHKQGMAHRDIKLENILIKKNYEIKIIDFGFGMYNPENKLQKFFCGTPNYMPPEIAEKRPYIGQLADMWSLGILVYKIFCADFPFKGKDEKDLYKSIKTGKFTYASYTPEYAKKIISSLIVLNPNKRMTCEEVLNSDWLKNK